MSEPNLNDIFSGGGLSSLLQNPTVAAKLPRIMEALSPIMAEMKEENGASTSQNNATEGETEKAKEPAALAPPRQSQGASARRRALLNALEPYLSDNRRDAMEHVNKVLLLIDMLSEVI